VPFYRRDELAPDSILEGPAVIEEKTSTIVLYRDQTALVDNHLNIAIEIRRLLTRVRKLVFRMHED
jgi:N-methylhydantoinase A